jgi:integrase/recombinase XerC
MTRKDIVYDRTNRVFTANFRLDGKRHRPTLISKEDYDQLTEEEQEQVVGTLWRKAKDKFDRLVEEQERHGQFLEPLLEEWLSSVASARDSKTVDHYRLDLQRFLHVAPPRTGQLSSRVQESFFDHLRSLGLSDPSINSAVRSVRVFVKWLAERELLKHPVSLKALRTVKKRPQFYSSEQIKRMQEYCRETAGRRYHLLYRAIWILSQTGMRGGELLNLKWSEVEDKRIKIVSTETWQVKSRRDAWVPISPKLREEFDQWDRGEEVWVLDKKDGKRYWAHLNELTASMRFVQTKCDCRGPKPLHGFRAGVATELLRQGASPVHVQRLLRHEDLATTMGYLDPDALEIQELVSKL